MYTNHEKYALVNGVVLDGTRDMTPRTGLAVCVDGSRIAAVCDAADVPEGYARVDLGGKYLLPGLINLHVHLPASGKPRKKPSDPKKLVKLITSNGLMRRIGAKPDGHIMQLCKERGAFQVSTISPAVPYALFDRSISHATYEQQENGKVVFEGIIAMAKACLADGVPVGLGTDTGCPYITHYDMWRELCYFVKYCGVTPAFALHSATLGNAALAGIAGETGSIQPGKCADMIVCAADPLADLTALRTLDMVIKSGYRVEHPQVKKMDNVERELDKFL